MAHQENSGHAESLCSVDPIWLLLSAPRKAQHGGMAGASRQPGVGPQVRGGKVDERQRVVAQEVAAQAQRVEGVVGQQVCTPAWVKIMKMQGACIA